MHRKAILITSHPRSGTHLLIDLLRRQFRSCHSWRWWGQPLDYLYLNIERLVSEKRRFSDKLAARIISKSRNPILKTHAFPGFKEWMFKDEEGELSEYWEDWLNKQDIILYLFRDPRSVMVSYHQFMQGFNPAARVSLSDFIRQQHNNTEMSRLGAWKKHCQCWLSTPGMISFRFEDIINNPRETIGKLGTILKEQPVWRKPLLPPKMQFSLINRFQRVLFLSPHSSAIISNNKRWLLKDWRTDLTRGDKIFIHKEIGDLLCELGYESSENWVYETY